jgi:signal transduction histidine kinase
MVAKISIILSILLQFMVAFIALRFIAITKTKLSWILISIGFVLMAFRRIIDLSTYLNLKRYEELLSAGAWIGIAVSILISIGIWLLRDIFYTWKRAELERKISERRVLNAIIRTEERERKRFAKDMHDGIGPLLSTIKLYMNELISEEVEKKEKEESMDYINKLIDDALSGIRTISNNLTPRVIDEYGLVSAINEFCNSINKTHKLAIDFKSPDKLSLSNHIEINLFRIINELVNNTLKHADASKALISITEENSHIIFTYSDNGRGFDYSKYVEDKQKGDGINNILTRVQSIDGDIDIETGEDKGINVRIEFNV